LVKFEGNKIRKFVEKYLCWLSEGELDAIIRRCDTDADEEISYIEFSELIRGIRPELSPQKSFKPRYEQPGYQIYSPPVRHEHISTIIPHSLQRPIHEEIKMASHYSPVKETTHIYHSHSKPILKAIPHKPSPYKSSTAEDF